jgi:FkbM family methyltransferase
MGLLLNGLYKVVSADDFLDFSQSFQKIEWVIEAGIHDAADTVKLILSLRPNHYVGCEPDSEAFESAKNNLNYFNNHELSCVIEILPVALTERRGFVTLQTPTQFGDGNTQVKQDKDGKTLGIPLAELLLETSNDGLLWLDVEGHSAQVLKGAGETLNKFVLMKIEIQMHDIDSNRVRDFPTVHKLVKRSFYLVRAPIHPGYFGDVVYLRKEAAKFRHRLISYPLTLLFFFLHKTVYPLIGKPKVTP